ncbi:MAG: hypothetical protein ABEJ60_06120 [Halodesulfurarchaeum sp.]
MDERHTRVAGTTSVLAGCLTVLVSVPPRWYGVSGTDSYLFDPVLFSPLWISRTLVPALAVLAVVGLLVGLAALLLRDWQSFGRLRRWSALLALIGFLALSLATVALLVVGNQSGTSVLGALFALAVGGIGALLFVPGALLLGYGYLRAGNWAVGGSLAVVPIAVPVLGYVGVGPASGLVTALPIGVTWTLLGRELLRTDFEPRSVP